MVREEELTQEDLEILEDLGFVEKTSDGYYRFKYSEPGWLVAAIESD